MAEKERAAAFQNLIVLKSDYTKKMASASEAQAKKGYVRLITEVDYALNVLKNFLPNKDSLKRR